MRRDSYFRKGRRTGMALLTAAVIAASLAGCQKEAQTVPTEAAATTAAETSAETEAAAETSTAAETEAAAETSTAAETETSAEMEAAETAAEAAAETGDASGEELTEIGEGEGPLYSKPETSHVRVPAASGTKTYGNGRATVDASNINQGYVMVKYTGGKERIKVQIGKGSTLYTYDLNARNTYEVFPFSEGSGSYSIKVFENVSGNQYAQVCSETLNVNLSDQFQPFLYPNQYVNFSEGSAAVKMGAEVAAGAADDIGVVTNVFNWVTHNISYDYAKAQNVQSGYLPDVDAVLASRKGICFDYAALMTAMLRSQDIPTKLVIGYTGSLYHAWVDVYIESVGWVDNFIYFDGQKWSLMDPTFVSSSGHSEEIKQYVGNASNYQAKYSY